MTRMQRVAGRRGDEGQLCAWVVVKRPPMTTMLSPVPDFVNSR